MTFGGKTDIGCGRDTDPDVTLRSSPGPVILWWKCRPTGRPTLFLWETAEEEEFICRRVKDGVRREN